MKKWLGYACVAVVGLLVLAVVKRETVMDTVRNVRGSRAQAKR